MKLQFLQLFLATLLVPAAIATPMPEQAELDHGILHTRQTQKKYISYGAMRRNTVPCSMKGQSYYNCHPGAQANPYSRGCSSITRCRRLAAGEMAVSPDPRPVATPPWWKSPLVDCTGAECNELSSTPDT
ncbi:hypothetical protein PVAG01_08896 [Phlyctema vagabunda]|uniref:Rapid alkalinization factor n=1 Tax=Phlyctema vagabunda TaxID=108571 RepID=A0ABR4PB69_9HELO